MKQRDVRDSRGSANENSERKQRRLRTKVHEGSVEETDAANFPEKMSEAEW